MPAARHGVDVVPEGRVDLHAGEGEGGQVVGREKREDGVEELHREAVEDVAMRGIGLAAMGTTQPVLPH